MMISRDTMYGPADCEQPEISIEEIEEAGIEKAEDNLFTSPIALLEVKEIKGPDPKLMSALDAIVKRAGYDNAEDFFQ